MIVTAETFVGFPEATSYFPWRAGHHVLGWSPDSRYTHNKYGLIELFCT